MTSSQFLGIASSSRMCMASPLESALIQPCYMSGPRQRLRSGPDVTVLGVAFRARGQRNWRRAASTASCWRRPRPQLPQPQLPGVGDGGGTAPRSSSSRPLGHRDLAGAAASACPHDAAVAAAAAGGGQRCFPSRRRGQQLAAALPAALCAVPPPPPPAAPGPAPAACGPRSSSRLQARSAARSRRGCVKHCALQSLQAAVRVN